MATHGKSYTPPKGRPTRARNDGGRSVYRLPAIYEWIIVGLVLVALMVAAWYFSTRSDGTPLNGASPAVASVIMPTATTG